MATAGEAAAKEPTAPEPDAPSKPSSPARLTKQTWRYSLKNALAEFQRDKCTDLAAALTYYAVLSLFPGLLALISLLGVVGQGESTVQTLLDLLRDMGQADAAKQLEPVITSMVTASGAGVGLVVGIAGALWSASGYVGAFGRAMNTVYDVDEGRPVWKLRPQMLLLTAGLVVLAAIVLLGLVVSGGVAEAIGSAIGLGDTAVLVWGVLKWPVILAIVVVMVSLLYYFTPNVRQPSYKWMSLGAAIAIGVAVLASVGFGFYVANFGSYNKTYGSLAGVIVFLLWLWIINNVLLLGAQVDAEVERGRQLQAGIEAEETLQLPPRDSSGSQKAAEKLEEQVEEGRALRYEGVRTRGGSLADEAPPRDERG
ncbi:YihY/virulence factor BrkB family protein [Janibacter melonis]|uniref:YihY/virulence factor BrkB family protein n=1 Tax=Janibacter melonis TaxID=262209 RepID=UPI001CD56B4A|nr:YihY/virulence factor BrkB family protein [Janibacter melonis]